MSSKYGTRRKLIRRRRAAGKNYYTGVLANRPRNKFQKGKLMISGQTGRKSGAMHWKGTPFPEQLYTEFTYGENITVNVLSGSPKNYYFCANGLYDPDVSGMTAPQPRYLDTLLGANNTTAPYNAYVVFASKCEVLYVPSGSDTLTMRALVGLGCFNSLVSGPSSLAELNIRADYHKKFLGYWNQPQGAQTLKRFEKIAPILGASKLSDKSGASANYNANPTNQAYWAVTVVPVDETSSYTYRIIVKITYYCKLYARNDVADS